MLDSPSVLNHVEQTCCHDGGSSGIGWTQMAARFLNHFKWVRSDHDRFSDWDWIMWPPDMESLSLYGSRYDSLDGGSVRRKATTWTQNKKSTE
jgi:hypothetical protein